MKSTKKVKQICLIIVQKLLKWPLRNANLQPVEEVTYEEVIKATNKMKLGKAAGPSEVNMDMIMASGKFGVGVLKKLCQRVLDGKGMPEEWKTSVVVPIFKGKGDVMDCGAYRGVKLLEHAMKIVERVLEKRIRELVISGNNAKSIFEKGKQELDNVDNWLIANKLSLNAGKTKCVYFWTVNSKPPPCALNLMIRNKPIERVSSIRVLGAVINENLSWKDHMLSLKNKLRATLGAVIRVKLSSIKTLY